MTVTACLRLLVGSECCKGVAGVWGTGGWAEGSLLLGPTPLGKSDLGFV